MALASGLGRQLRRAGRDRRPQRVRRHAQGHQAERLSRPGDRARVRAAGDLPGSRGDAASWPTACICSAAARTTASPSSSRTSSRSFEAPLNEARSLAVIEEIVRLIPNKPIRFVVNTHQHFDHTGGLRTYMHIGATIITHGKNFDFYKRDVLNYAPRTLQPDMVSLWPPTELAEGYYYETIRENYVLSDGTRNMNMYYVNPLAARRGHADGVSADGEAADRSGPAGHESAAAGATPASDQRSFYNAVRKLKLDVSQIVPVHGSSGGVERFREGHFPRRRADSEITRGTIGPVMSSAGVDVDALRRELERELEGEVRFDTSRARLLHRRQRLPDRAARRRRRRSRATTSSRIVRSVPRASLPAHDARRRHVAGRPGDRQRPHRRHLEVPQPPARAERRRSAGRASSRASCSTS